VWRQRAHYVAGKAVERLRVEAWPPR